MIDYKHRGRKRWQKWLDRLLGACLVLSVNVALADSLSILCCSKHYMDGQYNERNTGLIYRKGESRFIEIMRYYNSEYSYSNAIGTGYEWKFSDNAAFSVSGGLVTGYKRGLTVYVLPTLTFYNFNLSGAPVNGGVVALSVTIARW